MAKQVPLRQCLGIDVSKNHLQVNLCNLEADQRLRVIASTKFDNTAKGLESQLCAVVKSAEIVITYSYAHTVYFYFASKMVEFTTVFDPDLTTRNYSTYLNLA